MAEYLFADVSGTILRAYYALYTRLGQRRHGYREGQLVRALALDLRAQKLAVRTEVGVKRYYKGQQIGTGSVDLLVANVIPVEVKHVARMTKKHDAQLRAYMGDGGWAVGLLLNFGGPSPEVRRLYVAENDPTQRRGARSRTAR